MSLEKKTIDINECLINIVKAVNAFKKEQNEETLGVIGEAVESYNIHSDDLERLIRNEINLSLEQDDQGFDFEESENGVIIDE